jgi:endonuclease/exonuclease/phosphatase family metal-dependent hydrolase
MSRGQALSARNRGLLVVLAVVAALLPAWPAGAVAGPARTLTVMTRNLYVGTGLDNTVTATSPDAFIGAVTKDWANTVITDFPTRADALADEIVSANADVVGLQEVALWRSQTPSDLVTGATTGPNATDVAYDFLALLQAALVSRHHAPYVAVATSTNADVEAPRFDPSSPSGVSDVRLTDRDVLLVRAPLAPDFGNARSGHYLAQFTVTNGTGTPVTFTRGWTSADYRPDARTRVRIFETHLEVEAPPQAATIQVLQGVQARAMIAASPYPVIALGDFNSAADGSTTPTYRILTAGPTDVWAAARPQDPGISCCHDELLTTGPPLETTRIDLILVPRGWTADLVGLTGGTQFRTGPAPVWASDHSGVTARVALRG